MSIFERIFHSQQYAAIALRSNGFLVLALLSLTVLTATVLPLIVA